MPAGAALAPLTAGAAVDATHGVAVAAEAPDAVVATLDWEAPGAGAAAVLGLVTRECKPNGCNLALVALAPEGAAPGAVAAAPAAGEGALVLGWAALDAGAAAVPPGVEVVTDCVPGVG